MFEFAFLTAGSKEADSSSEDSAASDTSHECVEVPIPENLRQGIDLEPDSLHVFIASVDTQVEYLNCLTLPQEDLAGDILSAEMNHSDLIPGVYEGGLKVWECTFDLGELIAEQGSYTKLFKHASVLDLGCGSGILGILAIKLGATSVVFQDYNKDVLKNVTIKNYSFNCCNNRNDDAPQAEAHFFSGDWASFVQKEQQMYDVILTSETIYNTSNYSKLIDLLKSKLKPEGVVLLAAKAYYFGVGGGLRLFEQALDADGALGHRVAWQCVNGVRREILEIRWNGVPPVANDNTGTMASQSDNSDGDPDTAEI
ncbi:histidine protein methyltransferase 1 homolog [Sabethes cyaneus]|uniref:histidine protein methyltransferase 1 homolog n=1 Tax=Sabethes cyaneus TaxID=53552 RepID=UPI00237D60E2|nr:histidine protein methyltransferase 1 homolog [Sabethes cyaneus]